MLLICNACLQTDRQLRTIDDSLSDLFDDLSNYGSCDDDSARFCTICIYMLIKIRNFKNQCKLASEKLQNWKKANKTDKESLSSLTSEIPTPQLSLSNQTNFKVYFYQSFQNTNPKLVTSKYPHVFNFNVPSVDENLKLELIPYEDIFDNTNEIDSIKQEISEVIDKGTVQIVNDPNLDNKNVHCTNELSDAKADDETDEDDVVLIELAKINACKDKFDKVNEVDNLNDENENSDVNKLSISELRRRLAKRLKTCDQIQDENGDVINTNVILKNLGDLSLPELKQLKNEVVTEYNRPNLTPQTIKLLSDLHKKYSSKKYTINAVEHIEKVLISQSDDDETDNASDNYDDDFSDLIKLKTRNTKGDKKKRVRRKAKVGKVETFNSDASCDKDKICVTYKEKRQKISKEELRRRLEKVFSNCGELKDDDGVVIDTELILNSLDDMALRTLRRIKNQLAIQHGKRILTPEGIALLSQLHKKFSNEYSNGFTVEHLPTRERMLAEFAKRQFYEKYILAEHKCQLCFTTFRCDPELETHLKNAHNEKNRFACTVCNIRFNKETTLHWHNYKHRTVFKCKLCPFISYQKGTMITHYNQHKGVVYSCEICSAKFKSRSGHYMHMNKFHDAKHTCQLCGKSFVSEFGLKFHQVKKHQDQDSSKPSVYHKLNKKKYIKYMPCPLCQKRESGVNAMKRHFKTDHPDENFEAYNTVTNKHLCHICGKSYQSAAALNDHKNLHTGARPYTCDICSATFAKKGTLKTHVETHMPPTKECKVCGKKFKGANNLTNHMLYHKPPSKECQMCGKMFSTGSNLYNHMKRHLGERRYKCDICFKSFLDTSARNEHVRGVHNHIRRVRKKRN